MELIMETIKGWLGTAGILLAGIFTVIQALPGKAEPWTKIINWFGEKLQAKTLEQIKYLKDDVNNLRAEFSESRAKDCRTKILRFADELYRGEAHSKEHYIEILAVIDAYNSYCAAHPDFPNARTVSASARIKASFEKRIEKHDFLD